MRLSPITAFASTAALAAMACGDLLGADFDRGARVDSADAAPSPAEEAPNAVPRPNGIPSDEDQEVKQPEPPDDPSGNDNEVNDAGSASWRVEEISAPVGAVAIAEDRNVFIAVRSGSNGQLLHRANGAWATTGLLPLRIINELTALPSGEVLGSTLALDTFVPKTPLFRATSLGTELLRVHSGSLTPTATLNAAWASGSSDIYVLGYEEVRHYDGATWTREPLDSVGMRIWGADSSHVYVLSQDGGVRKRTTTGAWTPVATPPEGFVALAIGGARADAMFVTSADGRILHLADGVFRSELATETKEPLTAVWGSPRSGTWIVGAKGSVFHIDAGTTKLSRVTIASAPASVRYNGVGGTDDGSVYLVGQNLETQKGVIISRER